MLIRVLIVPMATTVQVENCSVVMQPSCKGEKNKSNVAMQVYDIFGPYIIVT